MYRLTFYVLLMTIGFVSFSDASYSVKVTVKYPFASGRYDTSGNWVYDSLVRYRKVRMIIYRSGDSLIQEKKTDNYGGSVPTFVEISKT